MTEDKFIRKHSSTWSDFEGIIDKYHKNSKKHRGDMDFLNSLTLHYNKVSSHLSYARTHFPRSEVCDYLNGLVSKGHNIIYIPPKVQFFKVFSFYKHVLPRIIISNISYILVSTGIFAVAVLYSWVFTLINPGTASIFIPLEFIDALSHDNPGPVMWNHPIMSSIIMSNNIMVSLTAFALGITMNIGTIYVLLINGMMLGSLSAIMTAEGHSLVYWSLILPHGVVELMAIFISGAAGLKIGTAILKPGIYTRKDALMTNARDALKLMGIVIPMLIFAALVEGFFTPSQVSPSLKIFFGGATGIITLFYFFSPIFIGRSKGQK